MASTKRSWRSTTASKFQLFKKNPVEKTAPPATRPRPELSIPTHFRCPISLDLMEDPVTLSTGITYDRQSIDKWLELGNSTCPVTKRALRENEELLPNHSLMKMIQDWCVVNRALGVERIPTPKAPITVPQAVELMSSFLSASRRGDKLSCSELLRKIVTIVKESEKNRRTVASSGGAQILAQAFCELSYDPLQSKVNAELLYALTCFPLSEIACQHIASEKSLGAIVSILTNGDLEGRRSAVFVLKELLVSSNSDRIGMVATTRGLVEALVKTIEKPISLNTTKASLVGIFYLCSSGEDTVEKFARLGLVSMLLEIIVDSDKSTTEKALAVFDAILSWKFGIEESSRNALTVPVLVKKIVRVSDLATEFAVSALWKLSKSSIGEECLLEALQVGVFQKLLLVLQVGCKSTTKDKASELLKMSNSSRASLECIETVDFKELKRPF